VNDANDPTVCPCPDSGSVNGQPIWSSDRLGRDQNVAMTTPDVQQVIASELALLTPEVRGDSLKVAALLDPDFEEIGASGRLWTRESMMSALVAEPPDEDGAVEASEMRGTQLAPDLILLTYVSASELRRARRSSLWRRTEESWQLLFHQGTPFAS